MTLKLTLDVPVNLAKKARRAGLLEGEQFVDMLENELERRKAGNELLAMLDKVHAVPGKPMTENEIQGEIDAYRAERRVRRETGH